MKTHTRRQGSARRSERGVALVFVTFAIAALLVAAAGALVTGSANSKATTNYKGASQAHFVAESGLSHAVQNINATGVINFQNDVVDTWSTRFGTGAKSFTALNGFTYTVAVVANGGNPGNRGRLVATASGPNNLRNVVVAEVLRQNTPATAPGAIYLATDTATNSNFNGNAFAVDGNDHDYQGGPGPGAPIPGISTRNQTNTTETVGSLNGAQQDNITGLGYQSGPPLVPSISTSPWAPSVTQMNDFIDDLIAAAAAAGWAPCNDAQLNNSSTCAFGTTAAPKITYCPNLTQIKNTGNVNGAGIMIVDHDIDIQGTINFKGLILVRGQLTVTGNATIYGSVWTQGVNLLVGGSAIVNYSTNALALANQVIVGNALPTTVSVVSLADCSQVPSGSNGCP